MTNPNYSYRELVHHLDMTATDPLVRKLIDYLLEGKDGVMSGLIEAGMDPATYEFSDSYSYYTPGEYIEKLRRDCEDLEFHLSNTREDLSDMTDERDRLKTRSVAELLTSMEELIAHANVKVANSENYARKVEKENLELKEKIDVWTILEK